MSTMSTIQQIEFREILDRGKIEVEDAKILFHSVGHKHVVRRRFTSGIAGGCILFVLSAQKVQCVETLKEWVNALSHEAGDDFGPLVYRVMAAWDFEILTPHQIRSVLASWLAQHGVSVRLRPDRIPHGSDESGNASEDFHLAI